MGAPKDDVDARVRAVLASHEHPTMTEARISAMREHARSEFARALRERGTDPSRFTLVVHVDDLVGPIALVFEVNGARRRWPLPAFQAWLSAN